MRTHLLFHSSALRGGCTSEQESPGPVSLGSRPRVEPRRHEWAHWSTDRQVSSIGSSRSLGTVAFPFPVLGVTRPDVLADFTVFLKPQAAIHVEPHLGGMQDPDTIPQV